jgi:hypothetical protein
MVALDEVGNPVEVPPVIPETPDEQRRMAAAKVRRRQRKVLEGMLKQSQGHIPPVPVASDLVTATPE